MVVFTDTSILFFRKMFPNYYRSFMEVFLLPQPVQQLCGTAVASHIFTFVFQATFTTKYGAYKKTINFYIGNSPVYKMTFKLDCSKNLPLQIKAAVIFLLCIFYIVKQRLYIAAS